MATLLPIVYNCDGCGIGYRTEPAAVRGRAEDARTFRYCRTCANKPAPAVDVDAFVRSACKWVRDNGGDVTTAIIVAARNCAVAYNAVK